MIDWTKSDSKIAKYFTVKEALFLPTYGRLANEADGLNDRVKANLVRTFAVMDKIRELFGKPIMVHVAYRPEAYNKLIGGSLKSAHIFGLAVDFHVVGMSCDDVRKELLSKLDILGIRMEDMPHSNWVHIDLRQVTSGGRRFFIP